MTETSIIVAMAPNQVIGKNGGLPWKISEDMRLFKEMTTGNVVLMGRKTLDSIVNRLGHVLPHRINVAVGHTQYREENLHICDSFEEGMEKALSFGPEVFIIGGASIYGLALPIADKLHISYIKKNYPGDTFFPQFDLDEWVEKDRKEFEDFTLVSYRRLLAPKAQRTDFPGFSPY